MNKAPPQTNCRRLNRTGGGSVEEGWMEIEEGGVLSEGRGRCIPQLQNFAPGRVANELTADPPLDSMRPRPQVQRAEGNRSNW